MLAVPLNFYIGSLNILWKWPDDKPGFTISLVVNKNLYPFSSRLTYIHAGQQ